MNKFKEYLEKVQGINEGAFEDEAIAKDLIQIGEKLYNIFYNSNADVASLALDIAERRLGKEKAKFLNVAFDSAMRLYNSKNS